MPKRKYRNYFYIITVPFLLGILIGYAGNNKDVLRYLNLDNKSLVELPLASISIENNDVSTCFTPPAGCGAIIAASIAKAEDSIYMQAYSLTSGEITHALIEAHKRGVKIQVLLDKSNIGSKHSKMRNLRKVGIKVDIDNLPGIAHNKVIIIDKKTVITGSFNFTTSADIRNAENVIIVNNNEVAKRYLQNWFARKEKSELTKLKKTS